MKFKVRDRVIVRGSRNRYSITGDGSYGVVERICYISKVATVAFEFVTGTNRINLNRRWNIPLEFLSHKEELTGIEKEIENLRTMGINYVK